ncbi:glycosyl transferase family protein [Flavobacterium cauense R2A-7]|uniref:GT2 family glycosyltransferase n=1 Tax=Flavobacterium cauense R2A-7 TaxID=1341154 RepID=V6S3T4_9FLAO|nr:glycosyltransferase family 2 protein [Flavobacterium cauense]ESU20912.1 glycosyl transferase family protein [Flavobacterium cauense R2A-7]KGO82722.1 glycosyl transferase [Flavobacterium cauense R2A-7]TWI12256.1 GT2 family glycosyltransferase [Flavobacterium cauense R2A-7]
MKKVSVVIVTYNGVKWIEKCIKSLLQSNYPVDIVVVDNDSNDATLAVLEQFPQLHLITSDSNLGFGKANNIGIEYALKNEADYVFLLNQDTWVFDNSIEELVKTAERNPEFGIVSPMHFSGDEVTLDENFKTYFGKKTAELKEQNVVVVPFVNAAAWLVSRGCLEKVGGFEPLFGHYGEDRNYCNRVLFHNFKIAITEKSKICHDRQIVRGFKKDLVQSKYKLLSEVLDVNDSLLTSYCKGLKSVFGLPKYFGKFYPAMKVFELFFGLMMYYWELVFSIGKISKARAKARQ